jgi:hypothetical protein
VDRHRRGPNRSGLTCVDIFPLLSWLWTKEQIRVNELFLLNFFLILILYTLYKKLIGKFAFFNFLK